MFQCIWLLKPSLLGQSYDYLALRHWELQFIQMEHSRPRITVIQIVAEIKLRNVMCTDFIIIGNRSSAGILNKIRQ